ncbi:MAG: CopG family antitoxin [Candidatus Omnitrophota bacterium]
MKENKDSQPSSLSKTRSLEEIADFWDTHSLDDYWDQTREVEFELRVKRRRRVTLAPELFKKIEDQARLQGVMPETLVNVWLAERLQNIK